MSFSKNIFIISTLAVALAGCDSDDDNSNAASNATTLDLRLMETTDLHGNMMSFDYFSNQNGQEYGFARTAKLISEAREEVSNSMLFDNGDLIQGSPMADYIANLGTEYLETHKHPVYKAMNLLNYDAANIGNHEFNYGLDFLEKATDGANFPYVVSNIFKYNENLLKTSSINTNSCELTIEEEFFDSAEPAFQPYTILTRTFEARDGNSYSVNIGVIGFTPPNIMSWDKSRLECTILVSDIKSTALYYIPKMKADGADIIVAIPHSGLSGADTDTPFIDNATWQLAQIDGIDAIMFGHDHNNFPTESGTYDGMDGVDAPNGKIYGKPAVMPGFWGNHLGVIDLVLKTEDKGESWEVDYTSSTAKLRSLHEDGRVDQNVVDAVTEDHAGTQEYMATPILEIDQKINSFFSAVEPDLSVQIVNEAQFHWGKALIDDGLLSVDNGEILLSVSAPFKGGRGGNTDYTNIDGDNLTNASVADLYVFDNNTPAVLKLTVADIKEWLEATASQQYKTVTNDGDELLHQMFRSYNLDIFYGGWDDNRTPIDLSYTINVSTPPRYLVDESGEYLNENPELDPNNYHRISDITYNGRTLEDDQVVYVVTNNYRASNNWIPGVANAELVLEDAAFSNRELVDQYLTFLGEENSTQSGNDSEIPKVSFDNANNFQLIGLPAGYTATFLSSPNGKEFAENLDSITFTDETGNVGDNSGYSMYQYTFK